MLENPDSLLHGTLRLAAIGQRFEHLYVQASYPAYILARKAWHLYSIVIGPFQGPY